MSYPQNPDTIVLKNKFYPSGLKEKDIYEYYVKNRNEIVNQVIGRDVMFVIMTEDNTPIYKRKHKGKYIQLTHSNFDEIITGGTLSIHSTMKLYEDIAVIDIDVDNWNMAKFSTMQIYEETLKIPFINSVEIRYTGKTSFHLFCKIPRKTNINSIKSLLENHLWRNDLIRKNYTIQKNREKNIPNIDLYRNVQGANFITRGSLSLYGLRCMEVSYSKLKSFQQFSARI